MRAPLSDVPASADAGSPASAAARRPESDELRARLRASLLSVYYASVGSRFEVRGAPSMLLRPQVRLVPLRAALATLWEESPTRFREAVWLLVRSTPLQGPSNAPQERYPAELVELVPEDRLKALSEVRREYRTGANLFAAALVAIRDGDLEQLELLKGVIDTVPAGGASRSFSDAVVVLFGVPPAELLARMSSPGEWSLAQEQMQKIESEVGLNLHDFVEDFANAVAFNEWAGAHLPGNWAAPVSEGCLSVLPVSSVVVQSATTLQAKATVTTVVQGSFAELRAATDPRLWSAQSDLMRRTVFVPDPFSVGLGEVTEKAQEALVGPVGSGYEGDRLLEEEGTVTWGRNDEQSIWFHNVLRVSHKVGSTRAPGRQDIDIGYGLCRSIESTVLWDRRQGGLLVDDGYLKVRALDEGRFRVTWSKAIRFSDRTPYSGSPGWTDFGELLNYLAPAALTWWVETETYSLGDRPYTGSHPSKKPHAYLSSS